MYRVGQWSTGDWQKSGRGVKFRSRVQSTSPMNWGMQDKQEQEFKINISPRVAMGIGITAGLLLLL
eukprot:s1690_g1.t1